MSYKFFNIANHKQDLLSQGLKRAGYEQYDYVNKPNPGDIIIAWNRKNLNDYQIANFEKAGGLAIIAENGYVGCDDNGKRLIALAFHKHLGLGKWHVGDEERWREQNIEIKPWRDKGDEIVVLAQRGIGFTSVPHEWALTTAGKLRSITNRPVRIRTHPGKSEAIALEEDLKNAHAVVTWSSASAVKAICAGIPAFYCMEGWIGHNAAVYGVEYLERPYMGSRDRFLQRISWAQWTQDEIASGLPFIILREFYESGALFQ